MLRIIITAVLSGSLISISAISLLEGFDMEGALIGLISLILLFGISSIFYTEYKKQITSSKTPV